MGRLSFDSYRSWWNKSSTNFQIETSISLSARREHSQLKRNIVYIFIAICPKIIELA